MANYLWPLLFHIWCSGHLPYTRLWWCCKNHSAKCVWPRKVPSIVHRPRVLRRWGVNSGLPNFLFLLFDKWQCRSGVLWSVISACLYLYSLHTVAIFLLYVSMCMLLIVLGVNCLLYCYFTDISYACADSSQCYFIMLIEKCFYSPVCYI